MTAPSGRTAPKSPTEDPRWMEAVKSTTTACCACDDYSSEILAVCDPRYWQRQTAAGAPTHFNLAVRYQLLVNLKSGPNIMVRVRMKPIHDADVTDTELTAAKTKMENALKNNWNSPPVSLTIIDPKCPVKVVPVEYQVIWTTANPHAILSLHRVQAREGVKYAVGVGEGTLNVGVTSSEWTFAHEYGHLCGLPDEYSQLNDADQRVIYKKPDGTDDTAIVVPPNKPEGPTATIMSTQNDAKILPRHSYNIAIEVQALLTAKLGRQISCSP